jgi:hypothetical protein
VIRRVPTASAVSAFALGDATTQTRRLVAAARVSVEASRNRAAVVRWVPLRAVVGMWSSPSLTLSRTNVDADHRLRRDRVAGGVDRGLSVFCPWRGAEEGPGGPADVITGSTHAQRRHWNSRVPAPPGFP